MRHGYVLVLIAAGAWAGLNACGGSDSAAEQTATQGGAAGDASVDSAQGGANAGGQAGGAGVGQGGAGEGGGLADGGSSGEGGAGGSAGGGGAAGTAGAAGAGGGLVYNCAQFPSVTADAACTDMAQVVCQLYTDCISALNPFASAAVCQARMKLMCMEQLAAPGSGSKPALFAAYADAFGGITCSEYYAMMGMPPQVEGDPAACGGPGTLADGKQCYVDAQCATGSCLVADNAVCGVCGGSVGAVCASNSDCAAANYCDSTSQKCVSRGTAGMLCAWDSQCVEGLYCDPYDHCAARLPAGSACTASAECTAGLICGTNKQCKPPDLGALGASCTQENFSCNLYQGLACVGGSCAPSDVLNVGDACGVFKVGDAAAEYKFACVGGSGCAIPLGQQTGTCIADAQEGQACDADHGADCIQPARCVSSICTLPTAALCPAN